MIPAQPVYTVGVGGLGKRGMSHAETFAANPRFRIVGLANSGAERLEARSSKVSGAFASSSMTRCWPRPGPIFFAFAHRRTSAIAHRGRGTRRVKLIAYEKPMALFPQAKRWQSPRCSATQE